MRSALALLPISDLVRSLAHLVLTSVLEQLPGLLTRENTGLFTHESSINRVSSTISSSSPRIISPADNSQGQRRGHPFLIVCLVLVFWLFWGKKVVCLAAGLS